jgi:hypothetical protein
MPGMSGSEVKVMAAPQPDPRNTQERARALSPVQWHGTIMPGEGPQGIYRPLDAPVIGIHQVQSPMIARIPSVPLTARIW